MKLTLKLFVVASAAAGAAYYAYSEYREWCDTSDKMLGSLEDIHLAFERLNGTAHRLESRMDKLVETLEAGEGKAQAAADHRAATSHRAPRTVAAAKPRASTAKRNALHGTKEN